MVNLLHRKQFVEISFDDLKTVIVTFTRINGQVNRKSSCRLYWYLTSVVRTWWQKKILILANKKYI